MKILKSIPTTTHTLHVVYVEVNKKLYFVLRGLVEVKSESLSSGKVIETLNTGLFKNLEYIRKGKLYFIKSQKGFSTLNQELYLRGNNKLITQCHDGINLKLETYSNDKLKLSERYDLNNLS